MEQSMNTKPNRCPNANDEPCKWPYCTCCETPFPPIDHAYIDAQLKQEDPLEFIRGVESDANRLKTAAFAVALVLALASILYITAI
jgi:hypothetical protein